MTVAVYPNLTRENGFEISSAVIDELESLGIRIIMKLLKSAICLLQSVATEQLSMPHII